MTPRPRSDSARTREHLLDAAERLFATRGVHAVSLRAINVAAGARNVSAAHYHFGSKQAVIAGVVARRMDALARERIAALAAVEADAGRGVPELRRIVDAMVLPFLALLRDEPSYVTALARVASEPGMALDQLAPASFWLMVQCLMALLRRALPGVPERVLVVRVRLLFQQTFVMAIELRRLAGPADTIPLDDLETIGADLRDYLVGGLSAATRVGDTPSAASPRPALRASEPGSPLPPSA